MIVSYSFTSFPQRAVIITASDGNRQLSVTEPVDGVKHREWLAFEKSGFAEPESFLSACSDLMAKLKHTEGIMERTLKMIECGNAAIDTKTGFLEYGRRLISRITDKPKAEKYETTLRCLERFLSDSGDSDILLTDFDTDLVDRFCAAQRARNLSESTLSFYCRNLNAIYNSAAKDSLLNPSSPFRNAPMNVRKATPKLTQGISEQELHRVFAADLADSPLLAQTRDILKATYLLGLNLLRILNIRPSDITPGRLTIGRDTILLTPEAETLLMQTPADAADFRFYPTPVFRGKPRTLQRAREKYFHLQRALSARLGLHSPLSLPRVKVLSEKRVK